MNRSFVVSVLSVFCCLTAGAARNREAPKADIAAIRASLQETLKDADSAKFRNVIEDKAPPSVRNVCGEINAKNSYGAYGGFRRFYSLLATQTDGKILVAATRIDDDDNGVAADMCSQYGM